MSNWKFHAKAITLLVSVIFAIFYFSGALEEDVKQVPVVGPAPDPLPKNPIYLIRIVEASWGQNCLEQIERARESIERRMQRLSGDAYNKMKETLPAFPERGNATGVMREQCEGEETCNITVNDELFASSGAANCKFALDVSYRCFSIDMARNVTAKYMSPVTLDCSNVRP